MRKLAFALVALVALTATSLCAAPTRVDLNGELVNDVANPGGASANAPYNWSWYTSGAGGGYESRWNTGSSSNQFGLQYEDEGTATTYPGTHSIILGGSAGNGRYGIQQTKAATAGKLYWFFGGQRYNTGNGGSVPWFDYGIESGNTNNIGTLQNGNLMTGTFGGRNSFTSAVIATSDSVTYHIGQYEDSGAARGINSFFDGLRVWEFDIPINSDVVNGNMETTPQNMSGYAAKGGTNKDFQFLPGWLPFGNAAGQVQAYYQVADNGSNVISLDQYKGKGRTYAFQRLNKGAGNYTISGALKTDSLTEANGMIGVDFTGGMDPNSTSVQWMSASTAAAWQTKVLQGDAGANGITIWLASGGSGTAQRYTYGQTRFDNIVLSNFVAAPEPSSMLALASGLIGMAGFVVRRRK